MKKPLSERAAAAPKTGSISTRFGTVWVAASATEVVATSLPDTAEREFLSRVEADLGVRGESGSNAVLRDALSQLREYFAGKRRRFDLPLARYGGEFERIVMRRLEEVKFGETLTYGELAEASGRPKAARAVGTSMRKNRIPIVLPCHRVVASTGLGGFAGTACLLDMKRNLIQFEADASSLK